MSQWFQCQGHIAIGALPVSGNYHHSLLSAFSQRGSDAFNVRYDGSDVRAEWRGPRGTLAHHFAQKSEAALAALLYLLLGLVKTH
eukprot:scaffold2066_cov229-Ochromonas_danica.AAC.28